MKYRILSISLTLGLVTTFSAKAISLRVPQPNKLQWGIGAGLNFGATPPLPIPKEVTKMHAWYANINPTARVWGLYDISGGEGVSLSFALEAERKSFSATTMLTDLEISFPGEENQGLFTGNQNVTIDNAYLTLPIGLAYEFGRSKRFQIRLEGYASILMSAKFAVKLDGDGLLNGEALAPENILYFNFGDQIRPYDLGVRLAGKFYFTKRWGLDLGLSYGITPANKNDFRKMFPNDLHNLYGFAGISYRWR